MYTVIVLEGAKMAPWLSDASYLNHLPVLFGFEVARITNFEKKTCFVLKAAKIPSWGLGYEHILVFLSSVNLFSGNKNSKTHLIGANKIYPRHFCSDENVYSNCLGRAKNGSLGLGDVFLSNIGLFWSKTDK